MQSNIFSSAFAYLTAFAGGGFFNLLRVVIIIGAALLLALLLAKRADHFVRRMFSKSRGNGADTLQDKRVTTVGTLLGSIARYAVWGIAIAISLSALGLGSAASGLITAAGLSGGLVIGFGAQKLLQDFFAGFVFVTDHPFAVGDTVTIDGKTGVVESLKLRTTIIRSGTGERHILPNGSIGTVTNHSINDSLAACDIYLPTTKPYETFAPILQKAAAEAVRDNPNIIDPPQVVGITAFTDRGMMCVRTTCRTKNSAHWEVERAIRAAQLSAILEAEK